MPQKSKQGSLGRSLIKERFGGKRQASGNNAASQHMREYAQVADTTAMNLKSVTELSSLDEFLETAELAGTEFTAERMNIEYVNPTALGVPSATESQLIQDAQNRYKNFLRIPRRPKWNEEMSTDELNSNERESFLTWRRNLAEIQDKDHITLTPYEKNLDFWRQLWRVIERSDLVVQIVDARDPLLFRCEDLEAYVKDVDPSKENMILINKADLLSSNQREAWADYFTKKGVTVAFWSAMLETESADMDHDEIDMDPYVNCDSNNPTLLNKRELISFFKSRLPMVSDASKASDVTRTIGMVGYPNVGKSSTINAILQAKKVAVSATPGRTKHFQTFFIEKDLVLCDCPGLVFPSFVTNKSEMILSGILSIDEMRSHISSINLLCHRIPRKVLEVTYGVNIPKPLDGEDDSRPPTSQELLDSYGLMRGFMTSRGQPDNPRCARIILKDFVKGKLLFCNAPPGLDQENYSSWNNSVIQQVVDSNADTESKLQTSEEVLLVKQRVKRLKDLESCRPVNEVDDAFFNSHNVQAFTKGTFPGSGAAQSAKSANDNPKPWKKHNNKNKKEKMRRTRNQVMT